MAYWEQFNESILREYYRELYIQQQQEEKAHSRKSVESFLHANEFWT